MEGWKPLGNLFGYILPVTVMAYLNLYRCIVPNFILQFFSDFVSSSWFTSDSSVFNSFTSLGVDSDRYVVS